MVETRHVARAFALALVVLAIAPASAPGGTYTVRGTCSWSPWSNAPAIRAYTRPDSPFACPHLNVFPFDAATFGQAAGWTFRAPAGTSILGLTIPQVWADARGGWNAIVYRHGGSRHAYPWISCPGGTACVANPGNNPVSGPGYQASAVVAQLQCRASRCVDVSQLEVRGDAVVTLQDYTAPTVRMSGPAAAAGWKRGDPSVTIGATDNTGIQRTEVYVNGLRQSVLPHACNYAAAKPCRDAADTTIVGLASRPDGRYTVAARAVDASGNGATVTRTVHADNTPPVTPTDTRIVGGAGWRAGATRRILWTNPAQRYAPIAAVRYSLCPAHVDPRVSAQARRVCVEGTRTATNVNELPALQLPRPGAWVLRAWLVDAAGNADPDAAVRVDGLGYDPTPPSVAGFAEQDPQDPARVRVKASDAVSGIAGGAIEVRRQGSHSWLPLATEVSSDGITAFVDDERLRSGTYELRATVTDRAGLQHGTDRTAAGQPKIVRLPIRRPSALTAGKVAGTRCRGQRGDRRCTVRLRRKPFARFGRPTTLHGRLAVAGRPVAGQLLDVWRRLDVAGAAWQRLSSVTTSATGTFVYGVAPGPASIIRFRYPGSRFVRGDHASVNVRVRARPTLRVDDQRVLNGETITLKGRLTGGWQPPTGALVELQARVRPEWRTFATARANANGRFRYQYRFTTVVGHARFALRARVRRQPGYPFHTGHSRVVYVRVRG